MEPTQSRTGGDARGDRPEAANSLVKFLRQVCNYAVLIDLCTRNAAREVPYIKTGSQGFHSWTLEEVSQFEAAHPIGTTARLALGLLLYTSQRRSDVVELGPQHVRAGWLKFVQVKNRHKKPVVIEIPVIPALRQIIDATPSGALAFLVTEFGKPFTANGFGNRFRKWCDEAGLPDCSAHGLRKASAARLAELGCTDHEIMAITGHQTLKEVARYTAAANRKKLAGSGMAKLAQSQTKNECVPLLPTVGESGTILVGKSNENKAEKG
jgi:integrase